MERDEIANAVLWPLDQSADLAIRGVERAGMLSPASDLAYRGVRKALRAQFENLNDLEVIGDYNVPTEGGVILASNHQSWMDVQVLAAACPRRVHFMAKREFERWPVLRHLIRLSESVYVHRGGDEAALESMAQALRSGWAVAIYPEGTIPGEEDVPRVAVDPETGLLPGRTGVVRLALKAGVPVVPVGVSGTGRAFPPEIYPRLELLRMPANTPVRIRFGEPISYDQYRGHPDDRKLFRELTNELMHKISDLVDHRCNYVPLEVPLPQPPKRERIGVLVLHGFASHTDCVSGLVPHLQAAKLRYEMPILRGHGTRYQDLRGVTAADWYVDAERALINLWNFVDRIVVVGLAMGGLVALDLAARHPDKVAGVVTVSAALKYTNSLARFRGALSKLVRYWPTPDTLNDPSRIRCKDYPKFPSDAFASLWDYSQTIAHRLHEVHVPILILQSKKDPVVAPESANIIYEKVSSMHREILWYHKSGHELMLDVEAPQVFHDIMEFVHRFELNPVVAAEATG
jgi:carboxylesterase